MTRERQTSMRFSDKTYEQIEYLCRVWGGVAPASIKDVVTECIRRACEAEKKKERGAK